jgi:hypothetical protein
VNNCVPGCADGHYDTYPESVTLTAPVTHNGARYFTHMMWRGPRVHLSNWGSYYLPSLMIYNFGSNGFWR